MLKFNNMAYLSLSTADSVYIPGRDILTPLLYTPSLKQGFYTQFTATLTNSDQTSVKACASTNSTMAACPPNVPFDGAMMCIVTQCNVKVPLTFPQGNYQLGARYQVCSMASLLCAGVQVVKSNHLVFVGAAVTTELVVPTSMTQSNGSPDSSSSNRKVDSIMGNGSSSETSLNSTMQGERGSDHVGFEPAVIAVVVGAVLVVLGVVGISMYLKVRRHAMKANMAVQVERQGYFDGYGVYRLYNDPSSNNVGVGQ
ncbi:hypothetical protein BJ741DRAFT_603621 [Chytriomyces cf. hyalinus JEL632]|nr:hypothetical protein BJ741DRAFT_603621 [Chytriomyces cf. hyalinus JEL632]